MHTHGCGAVVVLVVPHPLPLCAPLKQTLLFQPPTHPCHTTLHPYTFSHVSHTRYTSHTSAFTDLQLGKFTVKLNHRRLLDAMLAIAGVPAQKFRPICRCVCVWFVCGSRCRSGSFCSCGESGVVGSHPCVYVLPCGVLCRQHQHATAATQAMHTEPALPYYHLLYHLHNIELHT